MLNNLLWAESLIWAHLEILYYGPRLNVVFINMLIATCIITMIIIHVLENNDGREISMIITLLEIIKAVHFTFVKKIRVL